MARLVYIQISKSTQLTALADNQHNIIIEIAPERGNILDRGLRKLAVDRNVYSVYASPDRIDDDMNPEYAKAISGILDMDEKLILKRLEQDKSFVWIKREMEKEISEAVAKLELKGVKIIKERKRFYPNGSLASHLIGFTGVDDVGLEGIELAYDGYLKGAPGWRWTVRDAKRRDILSEDVQFIPPSDGLDVVLTIDETIQHIVETKLDAVYKKYKAEGASIIVMDPANGDVLALANRPSFDINDFSSSEADARRNRAVTDMYEPGSVFKIITASCAVEGNAVSLNQEFFCENGEYYIGGRILHDHSPYGTLTFREIIEKSSNIGVTKIAQILGRERVCEFIRLFGFGRPTGIDIPGEIKGLVHPASRWSGVSISSVPIGQEVAVTSIQLISAISAIANGGYLVRPRVVREIRDKDGNTIKSFPPTVVSQILSQRSSDTVKDILKGVVEKGTGRRARLERYTAAGKTGTAQKIEPDGRYSHTKFIATFVGFAPVEDPRIAVLVTVDKPTPAYYGGTVAAPVFKNVAGDVLKYLRVEPDRVEEAVEL
ncbi:MAG: hypothetical protein ISS34_01285 [Candidatus Omnitrophica bacterium]|nr:hypothetical protein [Candidatus Omnitrophota bacterium]